MLEKIKQTLENAIADSQVYVFDPNSDNTHFEAVVVSKEFEGIALVKQHQMVLKALQKEFDMNTVHALSVKTYTPEKWELEHSKR